MGKLLDLFRGLNRGGKRRMMRSLKSNNRAKTKGAFGHGPFEKYDSLQAARAAKR